MFTSLLALRPTLRTLGVVLFTLIAALECESAELHLRNGDRVTGELVRRGEGKIYFRSPLLGEITVDEADAAIIETVDTPIESLAGLPPSPPPKSKAKTSTTPPPPPGPSASGGGPAQAGGASSASPASLAGGRWKGKVEFGFQQQTGRQDSLNTTIRADAERTHGKDQFKASVRTLYGETANTKTTDRRDGSFRWRHDLSPRIFGQTVTSYLSDAIKQIDENYEQNAGVGYNLFKRDRHVANVGLGATVQYRRAFQVDEGFAVLGEFFEDYTYRINGRLTFLQDMLAQASPTSRSRYTLLNGSLVQADDAANYRIRFNTTLQGKLSERISMNLRFEYEFDNAIANRSAKQDQRISSSIGYGF